MTQREGAEPLEDELLVSGSQLGDAALDSVDGILGELAFAAEGVDDMIDEMSAIFRHQPGSPSSASPAPLWKAARASLAARSISSIAGSRQPSPCSNQKLISLCRMKACSSSARFSSARPSSPENSPIF